MTNHIEYFARTWVTFHNITSGQPHTFFSSGGYNKNSYSLAAMKSRAVYEYGGIYCIGVTSLCVAMRRYIYNFTQLSLCSCCSILLRKNRNIILFITAKEKWWGYWCNVSCEKKKCIGVSLHALSVITRKIYRVLAARKSFSVSAFWRKKRGLIHEGEMSPVIYIIGQIG